MITPDDCTSSLCDPPNKHCPDCSHAYFYGELDIPGRFRRFEFNPYGGVCFLGKAGDRLKVQPGEKNKKVWDAWGKWYDEKFK